jgi:hypothetical protein
MGPILSGLGDDLDFLTHFAAVSEVRAPIRFAQRLLPFAAIVAFGDGEVGGIG